MRKIAKKVWRREGRKGGKGGGEDKWCMEREGVRRRRERTKRTAGREGGREDRAEKGRFGMRA